MKNPGWEWYEVNSRYRLLEAEAVHWNHRQFLNRAPCEGGRLLDVGCGTGGFLESAHRKGYIVTGLDFNPLVVEAARARQGVDDVHVGTLESFSAAHFDEPFDVVTAFEVLEHDEAPGRFLERCFALTREGGYFALSVPYRDRWPNWREPWDEPPHHLTRWSKRALLTALRRAGYAPLEVRTGWIGSGIHLMRLIRFGVVSAQLQAAAQASDARRRQRHVWLADALHSVKAAVFAALGLPIDVALRIAGATGRDLYVLSQRPTTEGRPSGRSPKPGR